MDGTENWINTQTLRNEPRSKRISGASNQQTGILACGGGKSGETRRGFWHKSRVRCRVAVGYFWDWNVGRGAHK